MNFQKQTTNRYLKLISVLSIFAVIGLILPSQIIHAANANLKVSGVVRSYSTPNAGDNVRFDVYVLNNGQALAASSNVKFRVDAGNNGSYENTFYQGVSSISNGDTKVVYFSWTPSAAGYYGVEVCVDNNNSVVESNETDNCTTQSFNVIGSAGTVTPPLVINPPITNNPPQTPTVNIRANNSDTPITIPYNTSANLTWSSTYTSFCSVSPGGWTGTSGSQSTGNLTIGKTYSLNCTGPNVSDSITVNVASQTNQNPPVQNPPVVVTPPPTSSYVNLKITGVVRSYTTPMVGTAVRFDVYIKNDGNIASANSETKFRVDSGNNGSYETTLEQVVGSIAAGDSKTISFGWNPSSAGSYKVEFCADGNRKIVEFNETDNCSTQIFNVIAKSTTPPPGSQTPITIPPQIIYLPGQTPAPIYIQSPNQPAQVVYLPGQTSAPVYLQSGNTSPQIIYYPGNSNNYSASAFAQSTADLSVTDVVTSPKVADIVAGKPVTISASIKNNSNIIRAEPSQVSFKVDDNSSADSDIFYSQTIDFVQPGDYRAVSFTWTPQITGSHRIEICADYTNNITEYDEANNCTILYTNSNSNSYSYLPKISIYASPVNISKGQTSSLFWNSNNTTSCYATEGWSGYKSTSGSETIYPENSRNYTITCYNSYGQNSATATVFVDGKYISQNLVASCVVDPISANTGRQVTFAAGQAGAKGDVTYTWSGDISGSGITRKITFSNSGTKNVMVTVKDEAGRTATAQCQTKINGVVSNFISKIVKPKPPVVTPVCDCQTQKPVIDEPQEIYNINQNQPPVNAQVVPAGMVLTLGLDGAAKLFLWSSIILINLFLIAALAFMFMFVSRNYGKRINE